MLLTWIPARRRFVGTQGDARAEKVEFETIDVPIVKKELIDHLNAVEERHEAEAEGLKARIIELEASQTDVAEDAIPQAIAKPVIAPTVTAPTALDTTSLAEAVMELPADKLIPVLSAAIERLSETAGINGWGALAKHIYGWGPAAKSAERGLGMLMLAAFDNFGQTQKKAEPVKVAVPDDFSPTEEIVAPAVAQTASVAPAETKRASVAPTVTKRAKVAPTVTKPASDTPDVTKPARKRKTEASA